MSRVLYRSHGTATPVSTYHNHKGLRRYNPYNPSYRPRSSCSCPSQRVRLNYYSYQSRATPLVHCMGYWGGPAHSNWRLYSSAATSTQLRSCSQPHAAVARRPAAASLGSGLVPCSRSCRRFLTKPSPPTHGSRQYCATSGPYQDSRKLCSSRATSTSR